MRKLDVDLIHVTWQFDPRVRRRMHIRL